MITVPIKITLPLLGPLVLPQPQDPALIRFACPRCGQHLSATRDQISMTAPCPTCNEVIRVPIQSTLPSRPLVLPQRHDPALIRFACPRCGQHLSATRTQISMTGACPSCNEVMKVPIQSTLPPPPLLSPQESAPKNTTWGVALQVIGLLLCWTVVGAIVGIPLIIVGRRMATRTFICHCGNEMAKDATICPRCGAHFL
jgi:DNA-directed RNA polymerase subunit RPC12/RpoP